MLLEPGALHRAVKCFHLFGSNGLEKFCRDNVGSWMFFQKTSMLGVTPLRGREGGRILQKVPKWLFSYSCYIVAPTDLYGLCQPAFVE